MIHKNLSFDVIDLGRSAYASIGQAKRLAPSQVKIPAFLGTE
ncbi:MAG: hypothetical protein RR716_04865 [Christensenellaceae bacterium]